jgi:hypothetical protein
MTRVETGSYMCPVCGFVGLTEPPYDESGAGSYEICPSCGFEFGFDDQSEGRTFEEYRAEWIAGGAKWFDSERRPPDWDLEEQLSHLK